MVRTREFTGLCFDPIRTSLVCISGFRQHEGRPEGVARLFRTLKRDFDGPDAEVFLRSWDDNWDHLAQFIWEFRPQRGAPAQVGIFAYSWGGAAALRLAECLGLRGIEVYRMVLCDPVYRHGYWLGNWRAFVPWTTLQVPCNVLQVWSISQDNHWPRGHRLVAEDPESTVITQHAIKEPTLHRFMDEHPLFHEAAYKAAVEVCDG